MSATVCLYNLYNCVLPFFILLLHCTPVFPSRQLLFLLSINMGVHTITGWVSLVCHTCVYFLFLLRHGHRNIILGRIYYDSCLFRIFSSKTLDSFAWLL